MPNTRASLIEELLAAHKPELLKVEGHVSQIWMDGEWTSQKAGSLLHQRTLHCFGSPYSVLKADPLPLPLEMYGFTCVVVEYEFAQAWREKANEVFRA